MNYNMKKIFLFVFLLIILIILFQKFNNNLVINTILSITYSYLLFQKIIPANKKIKSKISRMRSVNKYLHNLWIYQELNNNQKIIFEKAFSGISDEKFIKNTKHILLNDNISISNRIIEYTKYAKYSYVANFLNLFFIILEQGKGHVEYEENRNKLSDIKIESIKVVNNLEQYFTIKKKIYNFNLILGFCFLWIGAIAYYFTNLNLSGGYLYFLLSNAIYIYLILSLSKVLIKEDIYDIVK